MNLFLQELVNLDLISVAFIHDYLQLGFSNEIGLTVNNKYKWSTQDYQSVVGSKVKEIQEESDRIVFEFSNGESLTVGFKKEDFLGPEAMLLKRKTSPSPIIWDESSMRHG